MKAAPRLALVAAFLALLVSHAAPSLAAPSLAAPSLAAPSLAAPCQGTAASEAPLAIDALRAECEAILRAELESQALVGLACGIVRGGELAAELHLGFADREGRVPVGPATMFRWASISKPLTAIAAVQLEEAKRLDLDRDVREYVAEFPAKPFAITSRQLLCHQSGIVHYTNGAVVRTRRDYDVAHPFADVVVALDTFKESPLLFEPGARYSYTTHGYLLLGAVVQRAGEEPFHLQVQRRIAEPLGMKSLRPDYQWEPIEGRAVGYRLVDGAAVRSSDTDVSWKLAGGGFISTVGDLARFAAGLCGESLLPKSVLRRMWTPQPTSAGERTTYGLGFGVDRAGDRFRVSHTGSQEKTRTLMHVYPEEGIGVVLMTNSEWAKLGPIATRLDERLRAEAVVPK